MQTNFKSVQSSSYKWKWEKRKWLGEGLGENMQWESTNGYYLFSILGIESKSSHVPNAHSTTELHHKLQMLEFSFAGRGGSTGVWVQCLPLSKQMLYHLNHTPSPFLLLFFE
jgi:hypothetical protein